MKKLIPEELQGGLEQAKRRVRLFSALRIAQAGLAVFLTCAIRNVINAVLYGGDKRLWGALLLASSVLLPLLYWFGSELSVRTADRTACDLRLRLLASIRSKEEKSLRALHSGALLTRLMDDCRTLTERYTSVLPGMVGEIAQMLGAVVLMSFLFGRMAVAVFACGLAALMIGYLLRRVLKLRNREVRAAEDELTGGFAEVLEQEELLRGAAEKDWAVTRTAARQKKWYGARRRLTRASIGSLSLFLLTVQVGTALLILWGVRRTAQGELSFGDFTAMLQLLALFRSPVSGLTGVQTRLAASDAARERLTELCELPEEASVPLPEGETVPQALVFEDVSFSYEREEGEVFSHFSARIDLTRWTCLTGISGRGKSTLYRLILGLYRPTSGRIYLETDRGELPISAASRSLFGFVPQTPVLFSGTLRENLLLAAPDADAEAVSRALQAAECGFIRSLPDGLDTKVGQFGEGLSVGQRQRIALARALLANRRVLLLDEITSALDAETAEAVIRRLSELCPSAVFATHRPELLLDRNADVLHLEENDVCD